MDVAPERSRSAFLPALHAFRALATVLVVSQHASWILGWRPDSPTRQVFADLLDNSTVLFVFLSGFLFAHLAGRHTYGRFLAGLFTQEHGPVDWLLAQKLLLCFALLATTQRFAGRLGGLRYLGFASFSVYLLHCYLVNAIKLGLAALHLHGTLVAWLFTTAAALGGSLLLVHAVRKVFGPWSIYVIGSADPGPAKGG